MSQMYSFNQSPEFSEADYVKISRLVYDQCGINLHEGKKELVKARLGKRIRKGNFSSFREYFDYVVNDQSGEEMIQLLDSISTNFTHFFRENQHFDYLRHEFLPALKGRNGKTQKKLRVWSAGCSTGEEPYTIAITLLESLSPGSGWDIKILATDLSTKVLNIAQSGVYLKDKIRSVSPDLVKKYFLRGEKQWQNYVKIKPFLKSIITFQRVNFMESFPFTEPFDCIFCRNVMIYFDKETRTQLVNRFYEHLEKGGAFFIGHSESLSGMEHPFQYVKPATYKK
jgi:chemotaxis protein methyltransferase CheR